MDRSILWVVTELGRGGAETQLMRVAIGLAERGWRVAVLSLMPPVGYVEELRAAGVPVATMDMRRGALSPAAWARGFSFARAWRPKVVCAFLYHAVLFASTVAPLLGARLVASIRDPSFGSQARLRLVAGLARAGIVRRVITNSDRVLSDLQRARLFPRASLGIVRNGLALRAAAARDPARRRAIRAAVGIADDDFCWLSIGNYQAPKDHPNLLDAFAIVVDREPRARLRLVGLGSPPPDVARRLAALSSSTLHLGERNDVLDLMDASDALVLGSRSEGLPNVILESFSMGRPVVATEVGGIPEIVETGVNGLLCPPRDPRALAASMLGLMAMSSEERSRLGEAGRARVLERHALPAVLDAWERLFEEVGHLSTASHHDEEAAHRQVLEGDVA